MFARFQNNVLCLSIDILQIYMNIFKHMQKGQEKKKPENQQHSTDSSAVD